MADVINVADYGLGLKLDLVLILFCCFSSEKAYRLLFAEMSSWVRRKTPAAECTGKTGPAGNV